jgi:DNA-binding CsgD family transcriptional regulator
MLKKDIVRQALGAFSIGATLVWSLVLLYIHGGGSREWLAPLVMPVTGIVIHTLLLFQWNLHHALNRVEDTGRIVWAATLISVVFIVLFFNSSFRLPLVLVCALPLISAGCCLIVELNHTSGTDPISSIIAVSEYDRKNFTTIEEPKRNRLLFFGFRIGLGLLLGVASGTFASFFGVGKINLLLYVFVVIGALTSVIAVLVVFRDKPTPILINSVLPFLVAFCIITVYLGSENRVLSRVAIGVAWLVGQVFCFNELPSYREMTRIDLVSFAYLEKAAGLIPYSITALITPTIISWLRVYERYSEQVDIAVVYYMLMMMVVYGIALTRHLLLYYPKPYKPPASEHNGQEEEINRVLKAAERFSLTRRESEVLSYLAKGYSRPYIEKKLFISKGTVKTHIFKIFQKLGVSSQDELIELVENGSGDLRSEQNQAN